MLQAIVIQYSLTDSIQSLTDARRHPTPPIHQCLEAAISDYLQSVRVSDATF